MDQLAQLRTIGDIAKVIPGHHYRKAVLTDPRGEYRVFHIGDLDLYEDISFESLKRTNAGGIRRDRLGEVVLRPGDVVLQTKGKKFRAFYFEDPPKNIIVPSHFFIIRCVKDICLGEYLAVKLNSALANAIKGRSKGKTPSVSKDSVLDLVMSLPHLSAQKQAIALARRFRSDLLRTYKELKSMEQLHEETLRQL